MTVLLRYRGANAAHMDATQAQRSLALPPPRMGQPQRWQSRPLSGGEVAAPCAASGNVRATFGTRGEPGEAVFPGSRFLSRFLAPGLGAWPRRLASVGAGGVLGSRATSCWSSGCTLR